MQVSLMSDFSQIAFVLGLKQGIILSLDKRVYLTLVFAHHNTLQHLGSNDSHLYSLLKSCNTGVESFLTQTVEYRVTTFNYTAYQYTLSKLQTAQHIIAEHIVLRVRYEYT